jgi:hypothetical protein
MPVLEVESTTVLRDTEYARELARASVRFEDAKDDNEEARIERLDNKQTGQVEIRFSWWRDGQLKLRPLDLSEGKLLELLREAIDKSVFSANFAIQLRRMLQ